MFSKFYSTCAIVDNRSFMCLINDARCMNGFAKLVADILNDNFTEEERRYIVAAKPIRVPKDANEQKLRLIIITEVFTRLAATIALYKHDSTNCKYSTKGLFYTVYIYTAVRELIVLSYQCCNVDQFQELLCVLISSIH